MLCGYKSFLYRMDEIYLSGYNLFLVFTCIEKQKINLERNCGRAALCCF